MSARSVVKTLRRWIAVALMTVAYVCEVASEMFDPNPFDN